MVEHIKIQSTTPRIHYTADGVLTAFDYPFAIFKADDLQVYFNETLQSSGYSVSGAGETDGGTVTFASPPNSGTIITFARKLNIERLSDFQEGGALRANVLNNELDYQIACLQEVADNLNRSMVLPPYAVGADINLTLPAPAAGKAIVWNEQGTNLENSTIAVNELESTISGYKDAAEAAKGDAITAKNAAIGKADEAASFASIASTKAGESAASASAAAASASSIASSLSTKANKDMDNLSATGKTAVSLLSMPSNSYVDYSYTKERNYTAPANGYFYLRAAGGGTSPWVGISLGNSYDPSTHMTYKSESGSTLTVVAPVSKNQVITPSNNANSIATFRFYYAQGDAS